MTVDSKSIEVANPVGDLGTKERRVRWPYLRRLLHHRLFVIGLGIFSILVTAALLADVLAAVPPDEMNVRSRYAAPSSEFIFGTDHFGRSIFSRVVHGARVSLFIGFAVVVVAGTGAIILGGAAGYFRRLDSPIMRAMDGLMAFPTIILALALAAVLGPSLVNAIIALGVVQTPKVARVLRSSVLVAREMEYVDAARVMGASHARILFKHILPNSLSPMLVHLTFVFAWAVLAEAILSFLGVGPPPPSPTWGNIIAEGRVFIREAVWITLFPGLAISATVLSVNLMGDGLRDLLDPRLKPAAGK